ncbi:hypothetical protein WUBG_18920 [Wuchereria bancrofti]|uniref:Uncharacterized protein n=1 Tax=Wuchereria bancrofti TaxID=6293 RepID=J9A8C9_WUCBA|nr:hypothetical protein WUBG_18920 [Wuchereria bancrofti]
MGHDHGPKIPSYTVYDNYREIPKLRAHEERLARIGLKDPWIRYVVTMKDLNCIISFSFISKKLTSLL